MVNKTVFIGDIHGRSIWKQIVEKENADRVIFIGDYFDSYDIIAVEQIQNFKDIIEYKVNSGKEEIMTTIISLKLVMLVLQVINQVLDSILNK